MRADDLTKIPELIEHYQEHQEKYGDDLISFINKHYGGDKHEHESKDRENHQELPFNHSHHICIDMKVDVPVFDLDTHLKSIETKDYFVYQTPYTVSQAYSILQPPKNNC